MVVKMYTRIGALDLECHSHENTTRFLREYTEFVKEYKTLHDTENLDRVHNQENLDTKKPFRTSVVTPIVTNHTDFLSRTGLNMSKEINFSSPKAVNNFTEVVSLQPHGVGYSKGDIGGNEIEYLSA